MTQIISYCSEELMTLVISLKSVFTGSGWFFLVMHVTDERPRLREVYYLTWCTAVNLSWKALLHNSRGCDMIIKTDWRRLFHGFVSAWTAPSAGWGVKSRWQTARLHAHTDYVTAANHMNMNMSQTGLHPLHGVFVSHSDCIVGWTNTIIQSLPWRTCVCVWMCNL